MEIMESTHHHAGFKYKMDDFLKSCSIEEGRILKVQFQSLFGGLSEPSPQIRSFLEMYRVVFQVGLVVGSSECINQGDPDLASGTPAPVSSGGTVTKVWLEKYRTEMKDCVIRKSQSSHVFVNESVLAASHASGLAKVLQWLREQQQGGGSGSSSQHDDDHVYIISKDLIVSGVEQEYSWIKAVNTARFGAYVDHSLSKEYRDGRDCLETKFSFKIVVRGGGEHEANHERQALAAQIDAEIERRVQSFPKSFRAVVRGDCDKTMSNCVKDAAVALRSKLEEHASKVKNANWERLAAFADSYAHQVVVGEYVGEMSQFLYSDESLMDVKEIEEKHKRLKAEGVSKWEKKISALDRSYSATRQTFVNVEEMMEQKFSELWSRKRETVLEHCLNDLTKYNVKSIILDIMQDRGVPVDPDGEDGPFCTGLSAALDQIEALIKDRVEAVKIGCTTGRVDGDGNGELDISQPDVSDEPPEAPPSPLPQTSSSLPLSVLSSQPVYKWELEPIPNREYLIVPKKTASSFSKGRKRKTAAPTSKGGIRKIASLSKGRKRKMSAKSIITKSLRTFGISLTNEGLRAGITIDHVPYVLTEISATAAGHSEKSTIIPLLMGLTSDSPNEFVFGNAVVRSEEKLRWHFDAAELLRTEHNHLSEPPLTVQLGGGEQVTFQLELVLAKIFYHVKTLMEAALIERFEGENNNNMIICLEKLLISVPPHFKRLHLRQILDAGIMIDLESKYVATFCEPTILAFDYFRKMLESRPASGNILVICQYLEHIVLSVYSYKRRNPNLTLSPLKEYYLFRDFGSTPSQEFGEEETFGRISDYLKELEQDYSINSQPLFVCLSNENKSYSTMIERALQATNVTYAGSMFHLDEFASIRGLTSVGDYGYWEGGHEKHHVDLTQDRFLQYRKEPEPEGSLSSKQVNECRRLCRSFFNPIGNSSDDDGDGDSNDEHTGPQPQPKRTRKP